MPEISSEETRGGEGKYWVFKVELSQQIPTVSTDFSRLLVDYQAEHERERKRKVSISELH